MAFTGYNSSTKGKRWNHKRICINKSTYKSYRDAVLNFNVVNRKKLPFKRYGNRNTATIYSKRKPRQQVPMIPKYERPKYPTKPPLTSWTKMLKQYGDNKPIMNNIPTHHSREKRRKPPLIRSMKIKYQSISYENTYYNHVQQYSSEMRKARNQKEVPPPSIQNPIKKILKKLPKIVRSPTVVKAPTIVKPPVNTKKVGTGKIPAIKILKKVRETPKVVHVHKTLKWENQGILPTAMKWRKKIKTDKLAIQQKTVKIQEKVKVTETHKIQKTETKTKKTISKIENIKKIKNEIIGKKRGINDIELQRNYSNKVRILNDLNDLKDNSIHAIFPDIYNSFVDMDKMQKYYGCIRPPSDGISRKVSKINTEYDVNDSKYYWTHIIPSELLQKIFYLVNNTSDDYVTTLRLILVCKSWRMVIHSLNYNNNRKLFNKLWGNYVDRYINNKDYGLNWHSFILMPVKYRALVYSITMDCFKEEYSEFNDSNIEVLLPNSRESTKVTYDLNLFIQIMITCPNITKIDLYGKINKDIYICISAFMPNIQDITFNYCDTNFNFLSILCEDHVNSAVKAVPKLESLTIKRGNIGFDIISFAHHFSNIKHIDLEKQYVDAKMFTELVKNCVKLEYIRIWRVCSQYKNIGSYSWKKGYMHLANLNKELTYLEIDSGDLFDDQCCQIFMNNKICPKLEKLILYAVPASDESIDELQKARPDMFISMFCCEIF